MSLTKASYSMITGAPANVLDFGAVGNGTTDDTAAIQAALAASSHVIVPIGLYLISSTVVVRAGCKLEFQGGNGNSAQNPTAYFIKKSTMTTWGITISQAGIVTGGGLLGQSGNTGGGVWLSSNAAVLTNFWVKSIGGYGVKVGANASASSNCNATLIDSVTASYCTDHGFIIDDAFSSASADANAGTISNCRAISNGGSGIYIGHAWWVTVLNCNAETNTGYGLYLSGDNKTTYPACRWASIIGGDFNEGNVAGQIFDQSYCSAFVNPDPNNITNMAGNGLQGSGLRSVITSLGASSQYGGTFNTGANLYPVTFNSAPVSGIATPLVLQVDSLGNANSGVGIKFSLTATTGSAYFNAGQISTYLRTSGPKYNMKFSLYNGTSLVDYVAIDSNVNAFYPFTDNVTALGYSSNRWTVVYATTGTINTSDAREKQQGRSLSDLEKAVAVKIKSSLKAFKWNDAVDKKGDKARWHFGVYAQDIAEAFRSEGLNPDDYGMFCYDEWKEQPEIKDEDGNITSNFIPAGNRYGVRYEELLCFVIGAI